MGKATPLALLMLGAYVFLCLQENLGTAAPEIAGATGLIVMLLAASVTLREETAWPVFWIMGFAAVFRLLFLWRAPELSDDIFRYVLDGMMTGAGQNPYTTPPASVIPNGPRMAAVLCRVNHPHLITIYPPGAQGVFALGSLGGVIGMKALMVDFDLGVCAVILKLLGRLGLPARLAVLYAWHPLPVIESGASGHLEAAAVFFLLAAFLLICPAAGLRKGLSAPGSGPPSRARAFIAGMLMGWAILTKWTPLLLSPGFLIMTPPGRRRHAVAGCLFAATLLMAPFLPEAANSLTTLSTYLHHWEFSGFLFRGFRSLTGSGDAARLACALIFAGIGTATYARLGRQRQPLAVLKGCYTVVFAFLLLTPTLHPWYAVGLAAFLPFSGNTAGLVFTWSVALAYQVVTGYAITGAWCENSLIPALIVLAPATAALAGLLSSRTAR